MLEISPGIIERTRRVIDCNNCIAIAAIWYLEGPFEVFWRVMATKPRSLVVLNDAGNESGGDDDEEKDDNEWQWGNEPELEPFPGKFLTR